MEISILSIIFEFGFLILLGYLYYRFQKRRILNEAHSYLLQIIEKLNSKLPQEQQIDASIEDYNSLITRVNDIQVMNISDDVNIICHDAILHINDIMGA